MYKSAFTREVKQPKCDLIDNLRKVAAGCDLR